MSTIIKPAAFAVFEATNEIHIKPAVFAVTEATGEIHIKPAVFAVTEATGEIHIKPAVFAVIANKELPPMLELSIRYKGEDIIIPFAYFQTPPIGLTVAIRWGAVNWYNTLVLTTSDNASSIPIRHNGITYTLSTSGI